VAEPRLVTLDDNTIIVTPPERNQVDARHHVEIDNSDFLDLDWNAFERIAESDNSTSNSTNNKMAAAS
jgi:hypothetical protein